MNYEIVNVIMKDGKVVDLSGKSPRYAEEWDNKKNVIVYTKDTLWISEKSYKISDEIKIIELGKVQWVTLERSDKEVEVTVTTKSGTRHKGGLLSVTDNNITLSNRRAKNNVTVIEKDSVKRILIHGESNVLSGLGYGALIGTSTGVLLGFAVGNVKGPTPAVIFGSKEEATYSSSSQNALIGGSIGGLLGGLIGVIVGITSSTPDELIEINSEDDFAKLEKYVRYPADNLPINSDNK
jgi:hypothetical protein